jgi:hypothetical protein
MEKETSFPAPSLTEFRVFQLECETVGYLPGTWGRLTVLGCVILDPVASVRLKWGWQYCTPCVSDRELCPRVQLKGTVVVRYSTIARHVVLEHRIAELPAPETLLQIAVLAYGGGTAQRITALLELGTKYHVQVRLLQ